MTNRKENDADMHDGIIRRALREALNKAGITTSSEAAAVSSATKSLLSEAVALMPRVFQQRSDFISATTKELHEKLYNIYVASFNKVSAKLDSVQRTSENTLNVNLSDFRALKLEEVHNMNGVKLHELYFTNSGDLNSTVRADSIPFMRLSRDWGTFDAWQLDFMACAMNAMEGWAVCFYDPYKDRYFNAIIEKHDQHVPLMAIPVIVLDTWHHAWYHDFPGEKSTYIANSMREFNWSVVEMRMIAAEVSKIQQVYAIEPAYNSVVATGNSPVMVVGQNPITSVMMEGNSKKPS